LRPRVSLANHAHFRGHFPHHFFLRHSALPKVLPSLLRPPLTRLFFPAIVFLKSLGRVFKVEMMLLKMKRRDGKARRGSIAAGLCDRGATPPACFFLFNPKGGSVFGAWLCSLAPYSPLRGCAGTRETEQHERRIAIAISLASRQIRLPQHRFDFEITP
jgi:hypothetical protein